MFQNSILRWTLTFVLIGFYSSTKAQNTEFDIADYQNFLTANQDLTYEQLYSRFKLPSLSHHIALDVTSADYLDSISIKYKLSESELNLIGKYGFTVTERLKYDSFGEALLDIYAKDLPVFVSTDAILFALHKSYDGLLIDLEYAILKPKLSEALRLMHEAWQPLQVEFAADPQMLAALNDVDVYLTVARRLLENDLDILSMGNNGAEVANLLNLIETEQPASYPLFNENPRLIDFSQFKPRGHYENSVVLGAYFKAMMWLGRTEFRLTPPVEPGSPAIDVTREIVDAYLVLELVQRSGALPVLEEIDRVLKFMVAESDNVTLHHLDELSNEVAFNSPAELWNPDIHEKFETALLSKPFPDQRINSQILFSDPMNPEQIKPPSAFLLMGQRFLIDAFVLGNVVYDKILFQNSKVWRELPSPLDALFVLGNNAVLPLLQDEINTYKYASNLNALRFLVDAYDSDFWESSLTNTWLNAIRNLNDRTNLAALPAFMQTGAWQQQKMNTQLAAWAELRHDNLLYAKQSYSGGATCFFPYSFVEPVPDFYLNLKDFALRARNFLGDLAAPDSWFERYSIRFFEQMAGVMDTLSVVAQKELDGRNLTDGEAHFLKSMLYEESSGCVMEYNGWYPRLFYSNISDVGRSDYIVADVHTAPTDAAGNMTGKVLHVGTGSVDMGVFVVADGNEKTRAYIGPLLSYYEHVTLNFQRLADSEWQSLFDAAPPARPDWVNVYLTDFQGRQKPAGRTIITSIDSKDGPPESLPETMVLRQNYPNPFNAGTVISFDVPFTATQNQEVSLTIYNVAGQQITTLVDEPLHPGTYVARWDGVAEKGRPAASGVYLYRLQIGGRVRTAKMTLLK